MTAGRLIWIDPRRWGIGLGPGKLRHRIAGDDVARREALRGDELGDVPGRQLAARGRAGEDRDRVPAFAHTARARETDLDARLVVERVVAHDGPTGFAGDGGLERAHGATAGGSDPEGLRNGRGDPDNEAHLRPRERSVFEGRRDVAQLGEPGAHVGEGVELATGEAEPLPGVIADASEAERMVAVLAEEEAGQRAEDAPAARFLARQAAEVAVEEKRRLIGGGAAARRRREMLGRHEVEADGKRGRRGDHREGYDEH